MPFPSSPKNPMTLPGTSTLATRPFGSSQMKKTRLCPDQRSNRCTAIVWRIFHLVRKPESASSPGRRRRRPFIIDINSVWKGKLVRTFSARTSLEKKITLGVEFCDTLVAAAIWHIHLVLYVESDVRWLIEMCAIFLGDIFCSEREQDFSLWWKFVDNIWSVIGQPNVIININSHYVGTTKGDVIPGKQQFPIGIEAKQGCTSWPRWKR